MNRLTLIVKKSREGLETMIFSLAIATIVSLFIAERAMAEGDHTCTACHPDMPTLCDTTTCSSNTVCGIEYGGSGQDAWVLATFEERG